MLVDHPHHVVDDGGCPPPADWRIDVEAATECVVTGDTDEDHFVCRTGFDEPLELDPDGSHGCRLVVAGEEVDHWIAALGGRQVRGRGLHLDLDLARVTEQVSIE